EPIGSLTLKNIAEPVEAYVLRLDQTGVQPGRKHFRPVLLCGLVVMLVCVAAGGGWWLARGPSGVNKPHDATAAAQSDQKASSAMALPAIPMHTPPQLSAVVLPFTNLGGVDDDTVDAITEDVTTDLARVPDLLVI